MSRMECELCHEEARWADTDVTQCQWCERIVHLSCIGFSGGVISGVINWSCKACENKTVATLSRALEKLTTQLATLMDLPAKVQNLEQQITELKSQKMSYKEAVVTNQSFIASPKTSTDALVPFRRRERINSNSLKRDRTPDEQEAKKQKTAREVITGTGNIEGNSFGVAKPPRRRHLYVSRVNMSSNLKDIENWCESKGAKPSLAREITREDASMRSFHLVFPDTAADLIGDANFWPQNVNVARYYLNKEAAEWLKKQSNTGPRD